MTKNVRDWSELSPQQCEALLHLSFSMPVHFGYLKYRLGVRANTIRSLMRAGLARPLDMREGCGSTIPVPFVTLTQDGQRVRSRYIRWHKAMTRKIGHVPSAMKHIVEARP